MFAYPLVMFIAVVMALVVAKLTKVELPLTRTQRIFIGLGGFCGAFLLAKVPFLVLSPDLLNHAGPFWASGKTILFGLIGGYMGVEIAKWNLSVKIKTGDSFAVPVAVGIGIGRIACFVGACCYGTQTKLPWGVVFSQAGELPRHPTQLYEAAFHLAAALLLYLFLRNQMFQGQLIKLYILAYFGFRFLTEFVRPEIDIWLGLSFYQWTIIIFTPLLILLWYRDSTPAKSLPSQLA